MSFHVVIPARYNSSRFPGKVLKLLHDKPIIQWVYEKAQLCGAASIVIATDDERVRDMAEAFGAKVVMTSTHHSTGTERIAEVMQSHEELSPKSIIVNLQGDEPLIDPLVVKKTVDTLVQDSTAHVATLATSINQKADYLNPNVVKVVFNQHGHALYFSRSPIPYVPDNEKIPDNLCFRHIGLYVYRKGVLQAFANWEPSLVESQEKLEQLRLLDKGYCIKVLPISDHFPKGIDTEQDLDAAEQFFAQDA